MNCVLNIKYYNINNGKITNRRLYHIELKMKMIHIYKQMINTRKIFKS